MQHEQHRNSIEEQNRRVAIEHLADIAAYRLAANTPHIDQVRKAAGENNDYYLLAAVNKTHAAVRVLGAVETFNQTLNLLDRSDLCAPA